MDEKDRQMTCVIKELIKQGIISLTATAVGRLALGPAGVLVAPVALAISSSSSSITWQDIRGCTTYRGIFVAVLKVAKTLLIENIEVLLSLAIKICRLIKRLYNQHFGRPQGQLCSQ